MTSARETFENDMMNILKFTMNVHMTRISTEETVEAPEIEDDAFWDMWFPLNCVKWISPPSMRNHMRNHTGLSIISAFHETETLLISTPDDMYRFMQDDNYWYNYYSTLDENIGYYLQLAYYTIYKGKIREWAQMEYLVCPK